MAEMTIRLIPDPDTGKKNIIISLKSDEDAMPHEHEQSHRALVNKILEKGLIKESELGTITVEREEEKPIEAPPVSTPPQGQKQAQQTGH
jgi:FtsH ternary system domain X3-analog